MAPFSSIFGSKLDADPVPLHELSVLIGFLSIEKGTPSQHDLEFHNEFMGMINEFSAISEISQNSKKHPENSSRMQTLDEAQKDHFSQSIAALADTALPNHKQEAPFSHGSNFVPPKRALTEK